jgi:tetratricopeptide (TPR) repeat protein
MISVTVAPPSKFHKPALDMALSGRVDAAEQTCRRIAPGKMAFAAAINTIAIACYQSGKAGEGISLLTRAEKSSPDDVSILRSLAALYLAKGMLPDALPRLRRLSRVQPNSTDVLIALTKVEALIGEMPNALASFRSARLLGSNSADVLWDIARSLMAEKRYADVIPCLQEALSVAPNHTNTLNDLGVALTKMGRTDEAAVNFERILAEDPSQLPARLNLSSILKQSGEYGQALVHLNVAKSQMPNAATIYASIAQTLTLDRQYEKALSEAKLGLILDPESPEIHHHMGVALRGLKRHEEAMKHLRIALDRQPANASLLLNTGNTALEMGDLAFAEETFRKLVTVAPQVGSHHRSYSGVHRYSAGDPHIAEMVTQLGNVTSDKDLAEIHFGLGKAYDDAKQYGAAFNHLSQANRIKRASISYDEAGSLQLMMKIRESFGTTTLSNSGRSQALSESPIFIVGMPRSGSSLVEQILSSHPDVAGLGERFDMLRRLDEDPCRFDQLESGLSGDWLTSLGRRYLESTEKDAGAARRFVDKMPSNFIYAGIIHLAMPNARIIHIKRDAVDTCISCFAQSFTEPQSFTYDLGELGRYYRQYALTMEHWSAILPSDRYTEVTYESLVHDVQSESRRLVEFCGLEWDDRCLEFHRSNGLVLTASAAQVRQPIYRSALRRKDHYEPYLGELLHALGSTVQS